jgi:hypothetical protein
MVVRSVGVLSVGKIAGIFYAAIGLIAGSFFTLFSLLGATLGALAGGDEQAFFAVFFGVGAIIIMPLLYGLMGFVGGIITAALYNLLAAIVGGVELNIE